MSRKMIFQKYSYLLRIISSLLITFCITVSILILTLIGGSFKEMKKINNDNYRQAVISFSTYFSELLNNYRNQAFLISNDNSLKSNNAENKIIKSALDSNLYYAFCARNILATYKTNIPNAAALGIHFIGTNYVITSSNTYELDDFINRFAETNQSKIEQMHDFLSYNNKNNKILSTFDITDYKNANLFIGIPLIFDKTSRTSQAVIFYISNYDLMQTSLFDTRGVKSLGLYIYNNDYNLLFASSEPVTELVDNEAFKAYLSDEHRDIYEYTSDKLACTVFKTYSQDMNLTFVSVIEQSIIERSISEFYNTTKQGIILILIVLLLTLAMVVYINYKPILKMIKAISKRGISRTNGEINTVMRFLYDMEDTLFEQREMLKEYALINLVKGIPLTEKEMQTLPAAIDDTYCVLTIEGLRIDTIERTNLLKAIKMEYGISAYITDILQSNHFVIICVLNGNVTPNGLVLYLHKYLYTQLSEEYKVCAGQVVNGLENIKNSYRSSLTILHTESEDNQSVDTHVYSNCLLENITLLTHFVQNGEKEQAIKMLNEITDYISKNIASELQLRHICHKILGEYFSCLENMNYKLNKQETEMMLSHTSIQELFDMISESISTVCQSIDKQDNTTYSQLKKDIIDYINNHFTDYNISRQQVADQFGISVYSMLRLFKESIGLGFKEYINAKRLELARNLLLTTDKSIKQIAQETGFTNYSHFSKFFKANYEVAPTMFRENYLDDNLV